MTIRTIGPDFHVTGQIDPDQLGRIAAAGYRTVICMRPDNEGFGQTAFAAMAAAAAAAGLAAYHIPVTPGAITRQQLAELKSILAASPGPVLAYCASGNRCAAAYQMAQQLRD